MQESRSLVGIHLSLNPGLEAKVGKLTMKEYIMECADCQSLKCSSCLNSDCGKCREPDCEQCARCECREHAKNNELDCKKIEFQHKKSKPEFAHALLQNSIKLADINSRKKHSLRDPVLAATDEQLCVLTRYNGHENDLLNQPGRWRILQPNNEREKCWVCDKWVYSLVFYNAQYQGPGKKRHPFMADPVAKKHILEQISKLNGPLTDDCQSSLCDLDEDHGH
jgi:hypothetical protein